MPICANNHQTDATDWCEVCGLLITPQGGGSRPASSSSASPGSPAPASAPPPTYGGQPAAGAGGGPAGPAAEELCPSCGTPREGASLFCEVCRYNFQTKSATLTPTQSISTSLPYPRGDSELSQRSQVNRPAESLPDESVTVTSSAAPGSASPDFVLDPPSRAVPTKEPSSAGGPASAGEPAQGAGAGAAGTAQRTPTVNSAEAGTSWVAVVAADRAYFTAMMARSGADAEQLYFPAFSPELQLPLTGHQVTIGRRRHSTGEAPDIDLSRAPEDPGVSHHHAVLVQQPDGAWSVVDQDSTNGTTVNLAEEPIRPYQPVPLAEGDRVHVGAWTTITITRA